ncbi:gamma-glutamyl-gamma-aminobutyrate hydrolase family protein [Candidatus Saccharibacteria bacterium]|nr:gamma-glutamyl-gamma-aminobutyrate hydrolase family protein [Candidatus Saccharibacteria bacterium]
MPKLAVINYSTKYNRSLFKCLKRSKIDFDLIDHDDAQLMQYVSAPNITHIVLSGGPDHVYEPNAPLINPAIFKLNKPILGICYGMQVMAITNGGHVSHLPKRENHMYKTFLQPNPLFKGLPNTINTPMIHLDYITKLPPGFVSCATTSTLDNAAMCHQTKPFYAVQFHPEGTEPSNIFGDQIIQNFLDTK